MAARQEKAADGRIALMLNGRVTLGRIPGHTGAQVHPQIGKPTARDLSNVRLMNTQARKTRTVNTGT